jgi:hypothetical protein
MIRMIFAALLLASPSLVASAASCGGAHPVITGVTVKSVNSMGALNHYNLSGTVVNNGSSGQASSVLQSVDIYQGAEKLDTKSIPPLAAGQSYTFTYVASRSSDAGNGTTKMTFKLDPSPGSQDCGGTDQFSMKF